MPNFENAGILEHRLDQFDGLLQNDLLRNTVGFAAASGLTAITEVQRCLCLGPLVRNWDIAGAGALYA